MLRRVVAID